MSTTVYTKDDCGECEKTKNYLDSHGFEYEVVNVSHDREALMKIKSLGFRAAPVVVTDDDKWSGHREDKLAVLVGAAADDDDIWG